MRITITQKNDKQHDRVSAHAAAYYYQRHRIQPVSFPDVFAYAEREPSIHVGCFGLTTGISTSKLPTEWYVQSKTLERSLAQGKSIDRCEIGEIGTRVVNKRYVTAPYTCAEISIAMTTVLLLYASEIGLKYIVFTGDRSVKLLARALRIKLHELGTPDLSTRDTKYVQKWEPYFQGVPRFCFGLNVNQAVPGCLSMQQTLQEKSYHLWDTISQPFAA